MNGSQKKSCIQRCGDTALIMAVKIMSMQRTVSLKALPRDIADILSQRAPVTNESEFVEVKSVKFKGLHIIEKCFNILNVNDGDPGFFEVSRIFLVNSEVYVVGYCVNIITFDDHFHAYEIPNAVSPINLHCVLAEDLLPAQTLHSYVIGERVFIKVLFTPCM